MNSVCHEYFALSVTVACMSTPLLVQKIATARQLGETLSQTGDPHNGQTHDSTLGL